MNTFGQIYRLTTFGESHGPGIGGVIDGMPAGIEVDMDFLQAELDRRKPGQSALTTARKEGDKVEILSGVFEAKQRVVLLVFWFATKISIQTTTIICAMYFVHRMPTLRIKQSMVCAITGVGDVPRHARP